MAKDAIKQRFGEEMGVELVTLGKLDKRKTELAKQYGKEIDNEFTGAFIPAMNGQTAYLLVGYSEDDELDLFEKYHHELQHAVDYFEVMKAIGELPQYFAYYTEFNAGLEGFFKYNMACLNMIPTENEQRQFIVNAKAQLLKGLAMMPSTIFDLLCYLARVSAIGRIERKLDQALFAGVPPVITDLANFINKYEPTRQWYEEFKTKIESIPVKGGK